ncbi:hypothetical protein OO006_04415 [Prosthecochloris sp. SCSIO W1101]|uniref:hypothetical protein n=1 Tax=Prosthecochloris sp. SCSIO W1101 TaxID=2992242 RepID=UPI00223C9B3F|nr:hypothetical protein [Prosthecochloris sp. SCSIO W1101]UZJ42225.1 hypothetical protein OO006_04415 [Prosthecochloris sp. SCSIO W1101]
MKTFYIISGLFIATCMYSTVLFAEPASANLSDIATQSVTSSVTFSASSVGAGLIDRCSDEQTFGNESRQNNVDEKETNVPEKQSE